jgi:dihydroorotate dehydrogenase
VRLSARLIAGAALPILRRLDPEVAHDLGLAGLKRLHALLGSNPMHPGQTRPESRPLLEDAAPRPERNPPAPQRSGLERTCFGLEFAHPLGLAAGFDKNGDCLDALGALGFSHVELGTVTPRPQAGNPKPRMFRARRLTGLVNRMGFNNKGVDHLVERLATARFSGIRGVSIGKNADTPIERAADDYVVCLRKVYAHADYVAVNVSSPNTARLRELQAPDGLERIVGALLEARGNLERAQGRRVPLLVKVAPDLDDAQLRAVAASLKTLAVDGVIATNTTVDLSPLGSAWPAERRGGLSGAPLHARSLAVISRLRQELGSGFPIVGVGGIVDASRALASLQAGADLLQIYTGFAYRGPALLEEILNALQAG